MSSAQGGYRYPASPFRVNLMVMTFMFLMSLLLLHMMERRAGGE